MPRKTTGTTTGSTAATRKKKAVSASAPVTVPVEQVRRTVQDARLEDEIRQRAYEIYLSRNGSPGDQYQDWLMAEQEILARH